ncbi:hypothetical protein NEFER03_2155 [Nematocida sp. LUAm3]|nr:hypothetical protein NEFER03_2155 [Nematocida sp. LUAm3]KAI5174626.1 hypothetical protein NEFER02_0747 [Nematocida sp. LUAm2]KAI5177968.1 hypothetical protein NEFER01_1150 [Nematocida sp. LUAm1]
MKTFSLLLLQCKKPSCRTINHLVPKECEVSITPTDIKEETINLMEAQVDCICTSDISTGDYILIKIIESMKDTCRFHNGFPRELDVSREDLNDILEAQSITKTLGEEKTKNLANLLFNVEIQNGYLSCVTCGEAYFVSNGIVDFVSESQK